MIGFEQQAAPVEAIQWPESLPDQAQFAPQVGLEAQAPPAVGQPPVPAYLPPEPPEEVPAPAPVDLAPSPPPFDPPLLAAAEEPIPAVSQLMPAVPAPVAPEPGVLTEPAQVAVVDQVFGPEPTPTPRGGGRVIVVMAGKGGSGKTITAVNLAVCLAGRDVGGVAIVDADLQFGDVALLLQLEPTVTVVEAAARIEETSEAELDAMLLAHESGVRVLPAPLLPVSAEQLPAKHVVHVIQRLQHLYQFVVVDTAPIFDDQLLELLTHADDVIIVVDMDLPSVKNARIALDALRNGGVPMDRIRLVVNRVNSKARLDLVELERSLGLRVFGAIPSDRIIPQSVNEGIPAVGLAPKSKVGKAFMELAALFAPAPAESSRRRRR
ncbi:AAA family ATPase [bacterium]|nr:AAA family ATPase [bacterium]